MLLDTIFILLSMYEDTIANKYIMQNIHSSSTFFFPTVIILLLARRLLLSIIVLLLIITTTNKIKRYQGSNNFGNKLYILFAINAMH